MTSPPGVRDIQLAEQTAARDAGGGRMYVAVVGIDRYRDRAWGRLQRAVSDARGARDTFMALGFQEFRPALFDDAATGAALHQLVTDELRALGSEDSLVVFFAGHGHTVTTPYADGTVAKRGYLVPVDGDPPGPAVGSWVNLEAWLHELSHLPPKHILVVIDACHSGIALNPVIRWRGKDVRSSEPLAKLRARRSRRIITSALDSELAMDSGPIEGHSLFTGCLIEALTGGLQAWTGQSTATGSEIALHVQRRVSSFPSSQQTPDFGALELDNRGELIIPLSGPSPASVNDANEHLHREVVQPRAHTAGTGTSRRVNAAPGPGSRPADRARVSSPSWGVDIILPKRAKTDPPAAASRSDEPPPPPPASSRKGGRS